MNFKEFDAWLNSESTVEDLWEEMERWKAAAQSEMKAHYNSACIAEEEQKRAEAAEELVEKYRTYNRTVVGPLMAAVGLSPELRKAIMLESLGETDDYPGPTKEGYQFNSVGTATNVRKEDLMNDDNVD